MNEQEKRLLADVSLDEPWALVEAFAGIVREHPTDVNRAADVLTERLRALGVPVTVYEPELYLSLPKGARVEADGATFRAKPPSYSADARDGLSAPLVYVPAAFAVGSDDVFDTLDAEAAKRVDVRGKIVLTEGFANPANTAHFEAAGALGLIAVNPGEDIHWGTCTTVWGTPGLGDLERKPGIPAAAVNRPDGERLKALAGRQASVTLYTEMEEGWYRSKVPVVELRGRTEPDKFVLLHGHYDSWSIGIGDNTTGDATMLEVARVLKKHQQELRRSVRIAWWPGHSTGRYAGSTWFADTFALDLYEDCVAQVNCDSPGCRWATEYKDVSLTAETASFAAGVIRDVTGKPMIAERAHQAGDYSFNNIGVSGYFMLLSTMPDELRAEKGYYGVGGCGGNIAWHTENDTLEIADKDILLDDIKIYALAAFRNANVEVLPFDWRAATSEFAETLARYQRAAGEDFDLAPAAEAVDALHAALDSFYECVASGAIASAEANDVIHSLARRLVPINFTTQGAFRHDPALTIPPLPDLALALRLGSLGEDERGFARMELLRGRNRVVATLRDATRRVERALA
ncbi:MAG TPA: M28 family peptidase [Trueperaceae bacterium]|nr:M28 family peptidase [Trueperaceae bacterium]